MISVEDWNRIEQVFGKLHTRESINKYGVVTFAYFDANGKQISSYTDSERLAQYELRKLANDSR